jgi:hypothetical protein
MRQFPYPLDFRQFRHHFAVHDPFIFRLIRISRDGFEPTLERRRPMKKLTAVAAIALALVAFTPPPPAAAQDPFTGAIVGGLLGAGVGGAIGGRRGAAWGAGIGAFSGAVAGAQAGRRYYGGGYFWSRGRCWYEYPNGAVVRVDRSYCY